MSDSAVRRAYLRPGAVTWLSVGVRIEAFVLGAAVVGVWLRLLLVAVASVDAQLMLSFLLMGTLLVVLPLLGLAVLLHVWGIQLRDGRRRAYWPAVIVQVFFVLACAFQTLDAVTASRPASALFWFAVGIVPAGLWFTSIYDRTAMTAWLRPDESKPSGWTPR